jgi:RecA DNA recombination protein
MSASARRLDSGSFPLFGPETGQKPGELPVTPQPVERPRLVPPPPPVLPGEREDVRQLRASLAGTAAARLVNGSELIRALETKRRDDLLATTLAPLDALLGGGLPRGKVVELTGRRTAGRFSIVLSALAASTSLGEAAALIDLGDHFDPQIGEATGIDLRRMLWIRPRTLKQAVMSAEMIAAAGFQTVILDAGGHPIRHHGEKSEKGRRVPDAAWVRLARSAEAHGTVMLVATPYALTGTASEALVAARRARPKWIGGGRSPRVLAGIEVPVTLEKHRHMKPGRQGMLFFATLEAVLAGGWQLAAGGKSTIASPPAASRQPPAKAPCLA